MFKKFLALTLVLVGILGLTACGGDETPTLEEILANISEAQAELVLPATTSTDLTLLDKGLHDVVITWESSDTDFIANDGTVTVPTKTEGDQTVTITASRTGGSDLAVSVDFATANGSATAGSDYNAASGTLSWVDQESGNKTFVISILEDAIYEGDETVDINLSNVTGGAALGSNSAVLTITESQ